MSWLSGLASRTEHLLNSLDQGAAVALQKPPASYNGASAKQSYRFDTESAPPKPPPVPAVWSATPLGAPPVRTSSRQGTPPARRPAKHDPDQQLIAFLNDSTPVGPSASHSRQSSVSSVVSVGNFLSLAAGSSAEPVASGASSDTAINMMSTTTSGDENGTHSESDQVRMLQKEIFNLNREMAQLLQRVKLGEKDCTKLKSQLSTCGDQLAEAERQCRHLQQRETDLTESLDTKDGQLAVLKVRLDEADGELRSRQTTIDRLQLENDRILQSSSDTSGVQSGTIQALQDRLHEAEAISRRDQQALAAAQQEHDRRLEQLAAEQCGLAGELTAARQQLQQQQSSGAELERQLAESRQAAAAAAAELAEYKLKAQRILQSKDQLIADLKSDGGGGGGLRDAELEQVCSERELAQAEVHKLAARVEQQRDELQEAEMAAQNEAQAAAEASREAEVREATSRRVRADLEQELDQASQEMRFLREEMTRQKTQALTRLQERDGEIEKLRRQITSKHVASSTEVELETRLRSLTENLIQKQTNIETLGTHNKSLSVQLERAQAQTLQLEGCSPRQERSSDPDPVRLRAPTLFAETPWDGTVTRRVKRAYSSLDGCSIRLGVFLKRYPIARIFVIGYMCLLHLWVMIVLFTYTPEMHGEDFRGLRSGGSVP